MAHPIPRVAAIHDLSGIGRCSLTIVLPVLSAMGVQCSPIPTAYLSANTAFPASDKAAFLDLTDQMELTREHWAELGLTFDAIYSGFLGSARQIGSVKKLVTTLRREDTLFLVDPVMGDHGVPYRTYTPEMCDRMCHLAEGADIITPNFTEAAILLGEDYKDRPTDQAGVRVWLERLSLGGKRSVALTGVYFKEGELGAGCFDHRDGSIHFSMAHREKGQFGGTGDLFASILLGRLLKGDRLAEAMDLAVRFVARCVAHTLTLGTPEREGVQFESLLRELF